MKSTGIVRKIDELGRIVLPKELRKSLNINSGDDFQISIDENKIILDDKSIQDARLYLTYSVGLVLKTGASLLGIQMPDRM